MKKLALHWQIMIGLIIGIIFGLVASSITPEVIQFDELGNRLLTPSEQFTSDWIKPWGTIFINMLKMIAVPLVLFSLINGVASLKDLSSLSRMGGKAIVLYLTTTVLAVSIGLTVVNVIEPGKSFSTEVRQSLQEQNKGKVLDKMAVAKETKDQGPLQSLVDMIPPNLIEAASDNGMMLKVIFFAILFGIGMVMAPQEKVLVVKQFFDGANEVVLKMVDIIMYYAPIGVFALMGSIIVEISGGDPAKAVEILKGLGIYSLTVILGLIIMVLVVYPLMVVRLAKMNYFKFLKGIMPAQLLAFSTSSSAATLPVTIERCEEHLGVSKKVTGFVLPLGATINMDGTSLYQAVAAIFIAQAYGVDLMFSEQLIILATATLASIGSAAVPGAGIVMLVIVLGSFPQIPLEGIGLIFAVDRILDMCRTVVNVTGDAAVATIVAKTEGELSEVNLDAE